MIHRILFASDCKISRIKIFKYIVKDILLYFIYADGI